MKFTFFLLFLSINVNVYSQSSELKINYNNNRYYVPLTRFYSNYYFPFSDFAKELSIPFQKKNSVFEAEFDEFLFLITAGYPYIIIKNKKDKYSETFQLPVSVIFDGDKLYLPLNYSLEALSVAFGKEVYLEDSLNLIISDKDVSYKNVSPASNEEKGNSNKAVISKVLIYEKSGGLVVKFFSDKLIPSYRTNYDNKIFTLLLADSEVKVDSVMLTKQVEIDLETDIVKDVGIENVDNNLEVVFNLTFDYNFSEVSSVPGTNDLVLRINVQPDPSDWFVTESENFIAVYREGHSSLIPYILHSAESSLKVLKWLFNYTPSEKIVINTYDVSDYGFGATTTIPQNYIRIEIEPFEPGYENIPYNERLRWLIGHELVHIVINDQASEVENLSRKIFQKVEPEQVQPITVFYSLLTNYSRYTPRWHQEAIAVFLETWMSGGFGRILGNFDEMFFRTMVLDNKEFPSDIKLDAKATYNSFLVETLFYLYGARFAAYLSIKYDVQKLINWFKISPGDFYHSFKNKFETIFNNDFDEEWNSFIEYEKKFQKRNIERLNTTKTTYLKRIKNEPVGFATQPHFDPVSGSVIFGYHKPHHLASIQKLNLESGVSVDIETLPTPSQFQVASTAFDYETGFFFFTTNNNQLYRDVWALDVETKESKILFHDSRIGHLTVSPQTHELWGVKHSGGKAAIIYSPYPYNTLQQVTEFSVGDEIQQLAVSPSGKYLAATLLRTNGEQSIILINSDELRADKEFKYLYVISTGSPENPSWSPDGKSLYWNSYTNGVSNIYKTYVDDVLASNYKPVPITHTLRGLFRPIHVGSDSLFAFEFTSEGLIPVLIQDKPVTGKLPAIQYLGQEVVKKNSGVYNLYVNPFSQTSSAESQNVEEEYNALEHLKIRTFIPVISGFQKQKMLGIFTHISDPLLNHDLTIEMGYSPFNENPLGPKWHFKGKYEYKKRFQFGIDYNAPDFYDLFNERKRGLIGTKVRFGNTHYWVYDNPLKIKQQSEIAVYMDQVFINDNLVRVSEPDFAVAQTNFNSRDLRKTIGSTDYEYGNEFDITLMIFTAEIDNLEYAGQFFAEWDHFTTFLSNHNIFHFKLAGGYHYKNEQMFQARFFFGGFGNRALENVDVKQYRKVFRFPGIPVYSLDTEKFVKIMLEDNLPPLRFGNASIGDHYLSHIDFAVYSQALLTKSHLGKEWVDIGTQINFIFKHWFNLESTLSAGIANAWFDNGNSWEWFVSFKLLRN
jgi:hypothetical protein